MSFYSRLARNYDRVFPPEPAIVDFLVRRLGPESGPVDGTRVLDLACGTGTYTFPLAERGFRVSGVDLEPAMIEAAERKRKAAPPTAGDVEFAVGSMVDPESVVCGPYQGAFCVGNSLVHLPSVTDVEAMINNLFALLPCGGRFVVQIVNFDRVLDRGVNELPTLTGPGLQFRRSYRIDQDGHVMFDTELTVEGREKVERQSVRLIALRSGELRSLLMRAGFSLDAMYGSYDAKPHAGDSFLTVAVARRP